MLLAITIWVITLVTVILFTGGFWWFPESASSHGSLLDTQFVHTLWVTGIAFILAQVILGYFVYKYKETPGRAAHYSHGSTKFEILWTSATTLVFFLMVSNGFQVWYDMYIVQADQDTLQIEITGQQFAWNIRYAGPDGQFGNTEPQFIDDAGGNPIGLDQTDPASADDLVLPTMAVPINRQVELLLRSKDVTHNFSVRELRIKQDTVPGIVVPLRFTATTKGRFEIACSELCGLGHHRMRSFLEVLSLEDYNEWLRDNSEP